MLMCMMYADWWWTLVDNEDQIDDNIQEWLAEDHQHDKCHAQQATEELRTKHRATQFASENEWIPRKL